MRVHQLMLSTSTWCATPQREPDSKSLAALQGKPSAGKSTFFNAATNGTKAKVGAHPFTTIEPNFSAAFYSIADPPLPYGFVSEPGVRLN